MGSAREMEWMDMDMETDGNDGLGVGGRNLIGWLLIRGVNKV